MSTPYGNDHINLSSGDFRGQVVGKQVNHHYAAHKVDWPIRVGAIPEQAGHYQHRAIAKHLDNALNSFGAVVLRQVLSGTGGVGKTQLAAHHARTLARITDSRARVDVLVWANAASREQITFAYAQAAQQLFTTVPENPEDAARLFLAWLQDPNKHQDRRWLIVWDDLADPSMAKDLWPPHDQPHGRVLVTTRRRDHSLNTQGRRLLDVDIYTRDEAHAFLTHALNEAGVPHNNEELVDLAHALGFLPLALGQAVTYIAELGMGCADYLQLFRDRVRILGEVFPDWETHTPLAATWELSVQQADTFAPRGVARPLMGLIALLDGSGIPERILTAPAVLAYLAFYRTQHPATPDPTKSATSPLTAHEARTALASLHRLNLITRTTPPLDPGETDPTGILVGAHQLVQRATREHAATQPTRESVWALGDALLEVWPEIERNTTLVQLLRDNTTSLKSHGTSPTQSTRDWLWETGGHIVLFRLGLSLGQTGQARTTVKYWEDMVTDTQKRMGSKQPSTLIARANLAYWIGISGKPNESVTMFQNLLTDQLQVLGPDHPSTLMTLANLANMIGRTGNLHASLNGFNQVLIQQENILGSNHPYTFSTLANIASVFRQLGRFSEALNVYKRLLREMPRTLGPDHPEVLSTRANYAYWHGETGNPTRAASLSEELLPEQLRVLGPNHPDTLTTRANITLWRGQKGNPSEAAQASERLLNDRMRVLGPEHPDTLTTRGDLAHWRGQSGDQAGAVSAYVELLTDRLRVLGPDHPDTLATRSRLAYWQGKAENPLRAAIAFEELLVDRLRILGPDHPHTLATRHNLADWTYKSGDVAKAMELLRELVRDRERMLGPDHPDTQRSRFLLRRWQGELPNG
ncbi:tetratricopeptide repeat protein [Nocardiopsis akebiae]|uniref:Tetratricopeptide repeat protein n=1 Tax=Nocardiopsis akebiae TaxID=2831968 RepID=A0ABX8C1B3_9ACTN|nr:FxSxx-COOH system tetratricopeptide repeat protein [Nocardiopsis akebiae]QUX26901.1 tetratricopeptide repeat protein [Nocardiopsis akebiae]